MADNPGPLTAMLSILQAYGTSLSATYGAGPAGTAPASGSAAAQLQALLSGSASATSLAGVQTAATKIQPLSAIWMGDRIAKPSARALQNAQDPTRVKAWSKHFTAPDGLLPGAGGRVPTTADAAINLPYTWNDKQRAEAYKRVGESTGQKITSIDQFNAAWKNAAQIAAQSWDATQGGKTGSPMTIWDVFDLQKREGAKYGFGNTTTSTQTSINKLSDGDTWSILQDAATKAMGRAPTHAELRNFASKANSIAVHNPTRVSTTTTTTGDGSSSSHSTTQQGADAADYQLAAQNQANADPETGAYQAASTYFNAMLQGINAVV